MNTGNHHFNTVLLLIWQIKQRRAERKHHLNNLSVHQQPQCQRHVQTTVWSHFFLVRHGAFLEQKGNTLQKEKENMLKAMFVDCALFYILFCLFGCFNYTVKVYLLPKCWFWLLSFIQGFGGWTVEAIWTILPLNLLCHRHDKYLFFPYLFTPLSFLWSSTLLTQTALLFITVRPPQLQEIWNASFATLNKIFLGGFRGLGEGAARYCRCKCFLKGCKLHLYSLRRQRVSLTGKVTDH